MRRRLTFTAFSLVLLAHTGCTPGGKEAVTNTYGQIEVDEIDVSSRLAARIKKVLVKEGEKVKAGQILVEFEDDIMAAKKRRAQAAIVAAQSQQEISQNATRPEEKKQLQAALSASDKQLKFAKTTLDRMAILFKEGAISQQQFDDVKFKYDSAQDAYTAALAKFEMGEKGARVEQKKAASALVEEARTALAEVEAYESDLKLVAPIDGEIQKIINREGELVPTGYPVLTLIKTDTPWATFHFPENRLKELTLGKEVDINVPAMEKQVKAKITYVSPLGSYATLVTTQDKSSFDLKTFEVHAYLEGDASGVRPGMTAIMKK